jgi:hypothetical protein
MIITIDRPEVRNALDNETAAELTRALRVRRICRYHGRRPDRSRCFFASAVKNAIARAFVRRSLEFCRTVPGIVFALLFVYALGLGPIPGGLAVAIHTVGALGWQFAYGERIIRRRGGKSWK